MVNSTAGIETEKPGKEQDEISVRVHNQGEEDGAVVAVSLGMASGFCAAILPSRFGGAAKFLVATHVRASEDNLERNVEFEVGPMLGNGDGTRERRKQRRRDS